MDTGSGDIRCLKDFVDVKGKLVEWSVGEEVERVIRSSLIRMKGRAAK